MPVKVVPAQPYWQRKEGFDVFVSDMSNIKEKYKQLLDQHGIEWEEGQHTAEKILNADEIIKSPGIPKEAPMVQKLISTRYSYYK